jgi:hypothetical protein
MDSPLGTLAALGQFTSLDQVAGVFALRARQIK